MAQMSTYLKNKMIDHTFRGITFNTPGVVHLALFSTDPLDDASGTELVDGTSPGYARISITIDAPLDGVASNATVEALFAVATGDWVTASHAAIFDEAAGGNMLMHKILPAPVSILNANNFRVPVGDLELTFA